MDDLKCPNCGASIVAQIHLKSGANPTSIPGANSGSIEHGSKVYNQGYEGPFLQFWNVYPLHRGKRKAQIAWLKSVKRLAQIAGSNEATAQAQILAAAERYRDDPNRVGQYTKYAEGWLNGDRWEDDVLPDRSSNGQGRESAAMRILRG